MNKPIIGITPSLNTESGEISMRANYLRAVAGAGGLPILLPMEGSREDRRQLAELCGGFLFTGGPDLHPFLFGEDTCLHCGNVSVPRDTMEKELFELVMETGKPILGICRGIQEINVFLGGDIYQDLPSQFETDFPIAHQQPYGCAVPSHYVDVVPGTKLAELAGGKTRIAVNSSHHQAVRTLAPGLTATAFARGGLVEGLEKKDYPYLVGVQWHPEYYWQTDETAKNLFASFVRACV